MQERGKVRKNMVWYTCISHKKSVLSEAQRHPNVLFPNILLDRNLKTITMNLTNHIYDVLIIGAGPVGLATAVGLHERGLSNILVLDQTRSFRQAGQTVDLLPNGLKALKLLSDKAYQKVKLSSYTFTKPTPKQVWKRRNLTGGIISSLSLDFSDWQEQYGEGRVSTAWYNIQTSLRDLLPDELIRINHRCVDITLENDSVLVKFISDKSVLNNPFAHWENSSVTDSSQDNNSSDNEQPIKSDFRAKLVIAADGINSTVRQILYNNSDLQKWAKPEYSGYAAVGCFRVDNVPDDLTLQLQDEYLQGDRLTTITPQLQGKQAISQRQPQIMLISQGENTFSYLLHIPVALETFVDASPQQIIETAQDILTETGYPRIFSQLIGLSEPEKLITRPYYIHAANSPTASRYSWSFGRVVLAGDAAHGMPPFLAQGTNQGFEDALILVESISKIIRNHKLDNQTLIEDFFHQYEDKRRPLVSKVQSATMESYGWTETQWEEYSQLVYQR